MKLLLDTNVLFSGLGFRGLVGSLLEEIVRQGHTIVSSEYILAELQEKIRLKFKGPQKEAALDLLLYLLQRIPLDVKPLREYQSNITRARTMVPEQDTPILAVAMLPDVDYLVTGDHHFLENNGNHSRHLGDVRAGQKGRPFAEQAPEAFHRLEAELPSLKGRKFYAVFISDEYRACAAVPLPFLRQDRGVVQGSRSVSAGFEGIAAGRRRLDSCRPLRWVD